MPGRKILLDLRGGGRIFSSWAGWVEGSKTRGCQESWADYPNWVVICHEGALLKFHWPCPRAFYITRCGKKFSFLGLVGHKCEQMPGKGHQYSKMQQERYLSFIQGIHLKLGIKGGTPVYMIGDYILVWWSFILWTVHHPPPPLKKKKNELESLHPQNTWHLIQSNIFLKKLLIEAHKFLIHWPQQKHCLEMCKANKIHIFFMNWKMWQVSWPKKYRGCKFSTQKYVGPPILYTSSTPWYFGKTDIF